MESRVSVPRCPDVTIPPKLAERFSIDRARGQLVYEGFMSKCAFDRIRALSDDPDFHLALEDLFRATAQPQTAASSESSRWWFGVSAGIGVLLLIGITLFMIRH